MDWSRLPSLVTEKIIKTAVEREYADNGGNSWDELTSLTEFMMITHNYARVCRNWELAVFNSKALFREEKAKPEWTMGKCTLGIDADPDFQLVEDAKRRQMISEGYMALASGLILYMKDREQNYETLRLIRDFADDSTVEYFRLKALREYESGHFDTFIDILNKSKRASRVYIEFMLGSNREAKLSWDTLMQIIQVNTVQHVKIEICLANGDFNWSFIKDTDISTIEIDEIEKIEFVVLDNLGFLNNYKYCFTCEKLNKNNIADFVSDFYGECKLYILENYV